MTKSWASALLIGIVCFSFWPRLFPPSFFSTCLLIYFQSCRVNTKPHRCGLPALAFALFLVFAGEAIQNSPAERALALVLGRRCGLKPVLLGLLRLGRAVLACSGVRGCCWRGGGRYFHRGLAALRRGQHGRRGPLRRRVQKDGALAPPLFALLRIKLPWQLQEGEKVRRTYCKAQRTHACAPSHDAKANAPWPRTSSSQRRDHQCRPQKTCQRHAPARTLAS